MKPCNSMLSLKPCRRAFESAVLIALFFTLCPVDGFSPYIRCGMAIFNKATRNLNPCKNWNTLYMSDYSEIDAEEGAIQRVIHASRHKSLSFTRAAARNSSTLAAAKTLEDSAANRRGQSRHPRALSVHGQWPMALRRRALQNLGAVLLGAGRPLWKHLVPSAVAAGSELAPASSTFGPNPKWQKIVLPLVSNGAAFCTEYFIGGRRFRAVVDTGSPFLLVNGIGIARQTWGYFEGDDGSSPIGDSSEVDYGGEDVDVEWRRGSLLLAGYDNSSQVADKEAYRQRGAWSELWTQKVPGSRASVLLEPINFGVVRRSKGKNGAGAIYLGVAKARRQDALAKGRKDARIRPTFLEQTDVQSLQFNFIKRTFTLASQPLLPRLSDAVPLVDLRRLGAPLAFYAFNVNRLIVNDNEVVLRKPCIAVIDTGVTGMLVSEALYQSPEEAPAGDWRRAKTIEVEALTEKKRKLTFQASRSRRTVDDAALDAESPPRIANFPLLVLPVQFEKLWKGKSFQAEGEEVPHFIILGLAFLSKLSLTIDVDAMRLAAVEAEA